MRHTRIGFFAALLLAAPATAVASQGDKPAPKPVEKQDKKPAAQLEALRQRMKARYPALAKLRDEGVVGETWNGFVDVVKKEYASRLVDPKDKKSGTIAALLALEVADRRALYKLLARQLETSAEKVGVQNGLRNLSRAKPEHWFRLKSGQWAPRNKIQRKKKKSR